MSRIEYKYLVPIGSVSKILNLLSPYLILDKYSAMMPNNEYTVRSIYFDTSELNFYHEKISGIKKRKKIRIRGYNKYQQDACIFLEIKRKNGPTIIKNRAAVNYSNLQNILESGDVSSYVISFPKITKSIENARKFLFHIHNSSLKPIVKNIYEREAYFHKFDKDWRVTIDKNLRSSLALNPQCLYEDNKTIPSLTNYSILEIKGSGDMPYVFRNTIANLGFSLRALSKYTICIESHTIYEKYLYRSINNAASYHKHKKIQHFGLGQ